jgi:SP family general alpha glucoside:H+ symporter-like MFS transporter
MLAERLGYKLTLIGSLVLTCVFICLKFFAENIATIEGGVILIGIPLVCPLLPQYPLVLSS